MYLKSLSINSFRNIESLNLEFSKKCNVLLGKNGQGKTSILEAAYLLGSGKSFRSATLSEAISFSKDFASVNGEIMSTRHELTTELRCDLSRKGRTKFFFHDKELALTKGYLGKLIVVCFVPSDTEIIRGGPSERRKFLDKHLVDIYPAHLNSLMRYQKALKSKMSLLVTGSATASLLDPWDQILAESGSQITLSREQFIADLKEHISAVLPLIAPEDGAIGLKLNKTGVTDISSPNPDDYYRAILEIRAREIASERALVGPHRDDLLLTLAGSQAREFSSQGQARTLTLLLKLGVIELIESKTGESPVVLLDDVDSELDERRAKFLFNVFAEKQRQVFISSTTRTSLWPAEAKIFEIVDGQIIP